VCPCHGTPDRIACFRGGAAKGGSITRDIVKGF
jgi:hypothetical protein